MEIISSYNLIIEFSVIIILSFLFNGLSKKTNIPAVLMLIALGVILQYVLQYLTSVTIDFFPILEVLGIVGLIMIVLEAALELELKREKLVPILKSLAIALIGLGLSTWAAASILYYFILPLQWLVEENQYPCGIDADSPWSHFAICIALFHD